MDSQAQTVQGSASDEFRFHLSPFIEGTRWIVYLGFGFSALFALFEWFQHRNALPAQSLLFQAFAVVLSWRRVFRPLPSRVRVEGADLVFHDIPSHWIDIHGIPIPILVRSEMRIAKTSMVPEWISGALTWNDMERGRSVILARGPQARSLAAWLLAHSVPPPVGG